MSSDMTKQLIKEIEKLKEGDYTSYQKFYNQTSDYLYQIIWNNVQDSYVADELINELYTNIYTTIGTELTDDSQFYVWAGNKAQTLSTTYMTTYGIAGGQGVAEDGYRADEAAIMTAANVGINSMSSTAGVSTAGVGTVGMDVAAGGIGQAGISSAAGGIGQAGMGSVARGAAQVGMDSVAGGIGQAGFGSVATGMEQYAAGTGVASGMASGNIGAGMAVGAAKTGLSLGAKIAIGVVAGVAAVGAGIGAFVAINSDKKEKENTTEVTTEIVSTVQNETVEESTEVVTEEVVEVDDTAERYAAYYEIVKTFMQEYPATISFTDMFAEMYGFTSLKICDLNNTGKEQLILSCVVENWNSSGMENNKTEVYDFINGEAILVGTIGDVYAYSKTEDGRVELITINYPNGYEIYEYVEGQMVRTHTFDDRSVYDGGTTPSVEGYYVDEVQVSKSEYDKMTANVFERDITICGDIQDSYSWIAIMPTVREKHNVINELAEANGDDTFLSLTTDFVINNEMEGSHSIARTTTNKYNEVYEISVANNGIGTVISPDKKSVQAENYFVENLLTIENDELIVVGLHGYDSNYIIEASDYDVPEIDESNAYSAFLDNKVATEDEYNAKVNELMNR